MRWMEQLEYAEQHTEGKETEKIGSKSQAEEIMNTPEDFKEQISGCIDSYQVLKQLKELGEDVDNAMKTLREKVSSIVQEGKEKNLISETDSMGIMQKVGIQSAKKVVVKQSKREAFLQELSGNGKYRNLPPVKAKGERTTEEIER